MQIVRFEGNRISTLLLLVSCFSAILLAGPEEFEGKPIAVIQFDPLEQPMPPSELAEILPLRMKQPLRLEDVKTAIEALYATGRYSDIAVDAELRDGGVVIRFLTKSNWFVGRVSVEGVPQPPSRGSLLNATELDLGNLFHEPEDTQGAIESLQRTLERNGFYESKVQPDFEYEPRTQQAHIRFVVDPGKRARIARPVIEGNPERPLERIIGATKWKGWLGWKPVTETRMQRGVERVRQSYQKRNHLMAQVRLAEMKYDSDSVRATPTLNVEAGPVVSVEATGTKLSRGKLERFVPVFEEQSVDRDLLVEGARNLTEYFQSEGYFDAKVGFTMDGGGGDRQRIVYTIDRGERKKVAHLEILGNRYFDVETIRERMLVAAASFQLRRGRYSESMLASDRDAITELYRTNGFREVKVTSKVADAWQGKQGEVAVFVDINEGQQWFVGSLEIEGIEQESEEEIRSTLQSAPGQPFSEANVATDRDNILAHYFNRGYPSASFEWSYKESSRPNLVDLRFAIGEGPRQFVREVLIGGLEATDPQLVHRRILLNPRDPISQAQILETQRRLYDLGIFAKVDTAIQNPDGEEKYKYILYQLEESRKYSVTWGFGAEIARIGGSRTSLESPAGEAGFSPRVSFDFSRINLWGKAHTASFRSRVSTLQKRALITYVAPQFRGNANVDLSFTTFYDDSRNVRTFTSKRREGSAQITHRWTRSRTLFYRFAFRRVSVTDLKIDPDLIEAIPLLAQPARVGILSGSYVDDRRDDPTDSRRGTFNSFDLGLASRFFGSQADFLRLVARNSTYHSIGRKVVLARTATIGWLHTLRTRPDLSLEEQDIPLPERFFAGGASTHRGFPENQAGPRDFQTGFPLGGKAMALIGTEIRFPLYGENIGGVLFHDAGNVYSRVGTVSARFSQKNLEDFNYMVHAVGFGIRYRTPIGPIRVDLAFVPNSPRFFGCEVTGATLPFECPSQTEQRISRFQFHFSLGQTF